MYDLVIENGRIIDPESGRDEIAHLGVKDGVIAYIGGEKLAGMQVVDGSGLIVSPGFIDIHGHEDFVLDTSLGDAVPWQTAEVLLKSGVTTMLGGNCGIGAYPYQPFLQKISSAALPINYCTLVGYSSLRNYLGIDRYACPTPTQVEQLKNMVREGLRLGLAGVSFGLQYAPGTTRAEMLETAYIVKEYNRLIAVHMRYDYPLMAQETVEEMLEIVRLSGVKLQISHLAANVYGNDNMQAVLRRIEEMVAQGYDIKCDMYPYDTWSTGIQSAVFDDDPFQKYNFSCEDIEILTGPLAGQRCTEAIFRDLRAGATDTTVACHNATPWQDIVGALTNRHVFFGSDGMMTKDQQTGEIKGPPRTSGGTSRFLRLFVKEQHDLDLKTAIGKMTLEPALRLQLDTKGRLQPNKDADITLFDLDTLQEMGDYGADVCAKPPLGIRYVIVGGKIVYTNDR